MTTSRISDQTSPDSSKVGEWLFRHRTSLPIPIAAAILLVRFGEASPSVALVAGGVAVTLLGEAIRLWGVRHIGAISRTRSDRLGPLVRTGPFARVRNPLYIGNILLWVGLALSARLVWLAAIAMLLLAAEYRAIVRWEEAVLGSRVGPAYREYAAEVPRWLPRLRSQAARASGVAAGAFSWRETLFSERGTLIALALGYALLWTKARF